MKQGGQDRADTEAPSSPPMRAGSMSTVCIPNVQLLILAGRTAVSAESGMDASEAIQRPKVWMCCERNF